MESFKNAVYVYYREDVDKANRIYDFVVRGLKKYTDVNVGTSTIHVEDSEVEVTCTGDDYKFADTKTSYNFQANDESQLDIQDDGLGQTLYFNIKSQKIVAIGTKEEIFSIGYDFVLNNLKMLLGLVIPAQIILLLFVKINLNFVLLNLS